MKYLQKLVIAIGLCVYTSLSFGQFYLIDRLTYDGYHKGLVAHMQTDMRDADYSVLGAKVVYMTNHRALLAAVIDTINEGGEHICLPTGFDRMAALDKIYLELGKAGDKDRNVLVKPEVIRIAKPLYGCWFKGKPTKVLSFFQSTDVGQIPFLLATGASIDFIMVVHPFVDKCLLTEKSKEDFRNKFTNAVAEALLSDRNKLVSVFSEFKKLAAKSPCSGI